MAMIPLEEYEDIILDQRNPSLLAKILVFEIISYFPHP
jgi:hypothetical protein